VEKHCQTLEEKDVDAVFLSDGGMYFNAANVTQTFYFRRRRFNY
jgi:hypothetical protein